ncbi:MAG: CapA family protein [Chloroflexia bacterium]|nr:CapA family protein [Chloroflexia bacterium]
MKACSMLLVLLLLASVGSAACGDNPPPAPVPLGQGRLGQARPTDGPTPTAPPRPPTPAAEPTWPPTREPDSLLHLALAEGAAPACLSVPLQAKLAAAGYEVAPAQADGQADLYLGYSPPADFYRWPLSTTQFVPVVSFWLPLTEVAYVDLEHIFAGRVGTWGELGLVRDETVVPLVLQGGPPRPLSPAPALTVPAALPDVDALAAALEQYPGGIALLPLERVDVRLRVPPVDGRDPLLADQMDPQDPLARTLYLAASPAIEAALWAQLESFAHQQAAGPPDPAIEIIFVGDIIPARMVEQRILAHGGDYTRPFAQVAAGLRQGDLTVGNLDSALSNEIVPPDDPYTFSFVANGRFCEGLRYAGFDAISLATNHSLNYGAEGLSHTITLLQGAGIVPFGAGMDLQEARQPAFFELEGLTFALLGYDDVAHYYAAGESWAGTAPAGAEWMAADIAAAHERADVVIPYFHWGWEYNRLPSSRQRDLAQQAIDAGADVVVGSHTHWVQSLERRQGVAILYSLGNFVFDQMWSLETRRSVIAHLIFRGKRLVNVRLEAVQIEDYHQPHYMPAEQAEELYLLLQTASPDWAR